MSLNLFTCPHEIPTIAKSTPLNPIVGSDIKHGRKEQSTEIVKLMKIWGWQLISHRQMMFTAKCQMLT